MHPYIVSFRRSGYNLLANLLHTNLETGVHEYEDLHYSHTRMPVQPYIAVVRALLPTMVSFYKLKGRFGIGECGFGHFIRIPQKYLATTDECDVRYNGNRRCDAATLPSTYRELTLPEQWCELTPKFAEGAYLCFAYHDLTDRPLQVVHKVAEAFHLAKKPPFKPIDNKVGWTPDPGIQVDIEPADYVLLAKLEDTVDAYSTRYRF